MGNAYKYAFFGSGTFAARCLELLSAWTPPLWIVTAPPKPAGRGGALRPTPVQRFAEASETLRGTPLAASADVSRDEAVLALRGKLPPDFTFVVDFGQIIREPILAWQEHVGCLNIHPSLLPLYRGAAPVQRALMDGAAETGVTVFKLAAGMDSGPVLLRERFVIEPDDDTGTLLERAAEIGVRAFIEIASRVPAADWRFTPQDDARATGAPKIAKEEERVDWRMPAEAIANRIRALRPAPGAWTTIRGRRLRLIDAFVLSRSEGRDAEPGTLLGSSDGYPLARAGRGVLALTRVQAEGKKTTGAAEWWNGLRPSGEEKFV